MILQKIRFECAFLQHRVRARRILQKWIYERFLIGLEILPQVWSGFVGVLFVVSANRTKAFFVFISADSCTKMFAVRKATSQARIADDSHLLGGAGERVPRGLRLEVV